MLACSIPTVRRSPVRLTALAAAPTYLWVLHSAPFVCHNKARHAPPYLAVRPTSASTFLQCSYSWFPPCWIVPFPSFQCFGVYSHKCPISMSSLLWFITPSITQLTTCPKDSHIFLLQLDGCSCLCIQLLGWKVYLLSHHNLLLDMTSSPFAIMAWIKCPSCSGPVFLFWVIIPFLPNFLPHMIILPITMHPWFQHHNCAPMVILWLCLHHVHVWSSSPWFYLVNSISVRPLDLICRTSPCATTYWFGGVLIFLASDIKALDF